MAFGGLRGSALTGNANNIGTSIAATGSQAVTLGDLIYFVIAEQISASVSAVADNLGNTYTATQVATDAGTSTGRAYFSVATVAGTLTAVTATTSSSANNVAVIAGVFEGPFLPNASQPDANPTNITTDTSSPFTCPPTPTLNFATPGGPDKELVVAWGVGTGSTVWAATSPNLLAGNSASQTILKVALGSQVVSVTSAVTPVFTAAANPTDCVLATTSFKGANARVDTKGFFPGLSNAKADGVRVTRGISQAAVASILAIAMPIEPPSAVAAGIDTKLAGAFSETQVISSWLVYDPGSSPPFQPPAVAETTFVDVQTETSRAKKRVVPDALSQRFKYAAEPTLETKLACAVGEVQVRSSLLVYDPLAAPPKFVQGTPVRTEWLFAAPQVVPFAKPRKQYLPSSFVCAIPDDTVGIGQPDLNWKTKSRRFVSEAFSFGPEAPGAAPPTPIDTTLACTVGETLVRASWHVYDPTAAPPKYQEVVVAAQTLVDMPTDVRPRARARNLSSEPSFVRVPPVTIYGIEGADQNKRRKRQAVGDAGGTVPQPYVVVVTLVDAPEQNRGRKQQVVWDAGGMVPQQYAVVVQPPMAPTHDWWAPRQVKRQNEAYAEFVSTAVAPTIDTKLAGAFGETTIISSRLVYDQTTGPHRSSDIVRTTPDQLGFLAHDAFRKRVKVNVDLRIVGPDQAAPAVITTPTQLAFVPSDQMRKKPPLFLGAVPYYTSIWAPYEPPPVVVPPAGDELHAQHFINATMSRMFSR